MLHECGKPCGNRSRGGVVLIFEGSPNRRERDASIAAGIHPALARIGNDPPTNPVVDPISRGGEMAHWAAPNVSTSRAINACPLGRVPDTTMPRVNYEEPRMPATKRGVGKFHWPAATPRER